MVEQLLTQGRRDGLGVLLDRRRSLRPLRAPVKGPPRGIAGAGEPSADVDFPRRPAIPRARQIGDEPDEGTDHSPPHLGPVGVPALYVWANVRMAMGSSANSEGSTSST